MTGFLELILVMAIIGAILWFIFTQIRMPTIWRNLMIVVIAICALLWLINNLSLLHLPR